MKTLAYLVTIALAYYGLWCAGLNYRAWMLRQKPHVPTWKRLIAALLVAVGLACIGWTWGADS